MTKKKKRFHDEFFADLAKEAQEMFAGERKCLWVTVFTFCRATGYRPNYVYGLCASGKVDGTVKRDGMWRIPLSTMEKACKVRRALTAKAIERIDN